MYKYVHADGGVGYETCVDIIYSSVIHVVQAQLSCGIYHNEVRCHNSPIVKTLYAHRGTGQTT